MHVVTLTGQGLWCGQTGREISNEGCGESNVVVARCVRPLDAPAPTLVHLTVPTNQETVADIVPTWNYAE